MAKAGEESEGGGTGAFMVGGTTWLVEPGGVARFGSGGAGAGSDLMKSHPPTIKTAAVTAKAARLDRPTGD